MNANCPILFVVATLCACIPVCASAVPKTPIRQPTDDTGVPGTSRRPPAQPQATPLTEPKPSGVRGFVDTHTHQFGNLAFGGNAVWGSPFGPAHQALSPCNSRQVHGAGGTNDIMGNLTRVAQHAGLFGHHQEGYPRFDGWPRWNSVTHQAMWEQWLLRAHRGGLQLMVMLAVNNEHLCGISHRATGRTCADQQAVELQLNAAKAMEAEIDSRNGGPGNGWYRIVYSPAQARAAISRGQLAVVLGIEVDNPFPCRGDSNCTLESASRLEQYFQQGVRHLFPIHFQDNSLGGASFDKELQVSAVERHLFNPAVAPYTMSTRNCAASGYRYRGPSPMLGARVGGVPSCNAQGLTLLGKLMVRLMMSKGMLIDIDHMSELSFNDTMNLAEPVAFPVISGHTGFVDLAKTDAKAHEGNLTQAKLDRIRRSGGMVSIIVNQGHSDQIKTFSAGPVAAPLTCDNTSETIAQAYLYAITKAPDTPIGIATDMNAYLVMPGGRFSDEVCPNHSTRRQLHYPFSALATGISLGRCPAVEGDSKVTKQFDFNADGLAHVGMLPDLVEDLRVLGIPDPALEPLMQSAEGYLRVWERALANRPQESPDCAGLRTQEQSTTGDLASGTSSIARLAQRQKDCQAGTGDSKGFGGRKPGQCLDAEDKAERKSLQEASIRLVAQLKDIRGKKQQRACWY